MGKKYKCEHGLRIGKCHECGKRVQIVGATKDGAGLNVNAESIFDIINFVATNPAVHAAIKESDAHRKEPGGE